MKSLSLISLFVTLITAAPEGPTPPPPYPGLLAAPPENNPYPLLPGPYPFPYPFPYPRPYPGQFGPGFGPPGPPGSVYATQLPANTLGSANWANPNEIRPGHKGILPKILMGAL